MPPLKLPSKMIVHSSRRDPHRPGRSIRCAGIAGALSPENGRKGWKDALLRVMVLQALALHTQGEKDPAYQVLTEALTLAEPGGFIRLFIEKGEPMRSLIADFRTGLKNNPAIALIPGGYVDKLLAAFEPSETVVGSTTINPQSELIEPLSQRELEVLQLICQGLLNHEICERLSSPWIRSRVQPQDL